jgi:transcriptional regulator with XRE-family HTH domain
MPDSSGDKSFAGLALRDLRERASLSQIELASRCGLKQYDISKRENGITQIGVGEYKKWDEWLGLRAGTFEDKVRSKERAADIEARLRMAVRSDTPQDAVVSSLGPMIAEMAEFADGDDLIGLYERLLACAQGLVESVRNARGGPSNLGRGGYFRHGDSPHEVGGHEGK